MGRNEEVYRIIEDSAVLSNLLAPSVPTFTNYGFNLHPLTPTYGRWKMEENKYCLDESMRHGLPIYIYLLLQSSLEAYTNEGTFFVDDDNQNIQRKIIDTRVVSPLCLTFKFRSLLLSPFAASFIFARSTEILSAEDSLILRWGVTCEHLPAFSNETPRGFLRPCHHSSAVAKYWSKKVLSTGNSFVPIIFRSSFETSSSSAVGGAILERTLSVDRGAYKRWGTTHPGHPHRARCRELYLALGLSCRLGKDLANLLR